MLLALDIGNTNIVLGVFDGKTLAHSWRLTTLRDRTADELGLLMHGLFDVSGVDRQAVQAVIMASVVPPLTSPARAMVERYLGVKAMVVEPGLETGMPILYDPPSDVGADRIVNGIAAYEQYGRTAECPLVVVATRSSVYDKLISNVMEGRARDARVIAVATEGDPQIERFADDVCWVPDTHEALSPVLAIIPLQLFAYHVALARGTDVDQPRNLAKSVTVE